MLGILRCVCCVCCECCGLGVGIVVNVANDVTVALQIVLML